ncbi:TPA: sigma-54-dependent Fis family transcriptional regulator [Candidatus Poribacteria bacterium]|nr:sigma-54-dependent Fis family transcriptional regulator [Candidatus Poribacteria bacterium]
MQSILIIDDDKPTLEAMSDALESQGYLVVSKTSGKSALKELQERRFDIVLTDWKMPDMDGIEILKAVKNIDPFTQVILITAYGSVDNAVEAMKLGAVDYITKPVKNLAELRNKVKNAIENQIQSLKQQNAILQSQNEILLSQNLFLQQQINENYGFSNIIGKSKKMQDIFNQLRLISPTNANVLIYGETGTGKELIARAIHSNSLRKDKPFIPINCAALSSDLLESELFGHEKGAFTGAIKRRQGAFELANGGTLLLDEVSEMSLEIQAKFLRVVENQQFMRLGGETNVSIDVRIIAATNKNLEQEVESGKFRRDLFYRLRVVTINLPPLRERKEDIPFLVDAFIKELSSKNGKNVTSIDREALNKLMSYDWPGNIRELKNCIESMIVMAQSTKLGVEDLPENIKNITTSEIKSSSFAVMSIDDIEKEAIKKAMIATNGNKTQAAEILGMGLRTLHRKIKKYGIA